VREVLAATSEYLNAEFILEESNLLADTRLRRKKTLRGSGHVKIVVRHFPDVP
jgi:hypothetical protein